MRLLVLACLVPALAACGMLPERMRPDRVLPDGWFEGAPDYREAQAAPPPEVPDHLSDDRVRDAMAIPDLPPSPGTPDDLIEPPRPEGLLGTGPDPDTVKIQRLGDRQWAVAGGTPSEIWPEVKQFLADNGVAIAREVPAEGTLETTWLLVDRVQYADAVRSALVEATERGPGTQVRDKFRIRVEGGVRRGTAEVHVRHYATADYQETLEPGDWPLASTMPSAEFAVLRALAEYLASGRTNTAISFQAQAIRAEPKARLIADRSGAPALHLALDYDRAWATVGQALDNAELEVLLLDKDTRSFEFVFDPAAAEDGGRRGFFRRLNPFSGGGVQPLELHLEPSDAGWFVRVFRDADSPADRELARSVLEVLSDHAS
jgi:outer membrane protein assembly factor BamC